MRLINHFKFGGFVWILFLLSGQLASAQDSTVWDRKALRDSVTSLLTKYQELHSQLNHEADPSVERDFIHLFANPRVQVVNDLDGQSRSDKISIEEYIVKLSDLFPEGLTVNLDLARISVDPPRYDGNNRYLIRIRLHRTIGGISDGKVFSSSEKIIFQIAFLYNNNIPDSFSFYGMERPSKGQNFLTASVSPAFTGFVNSTIGNDERLSLVNGSGYKGGLLYSHYFSDHFGIGSGARFSQYSGNLRLDKFDAFGSFDPNLRDVIIENEVSFIEVPFFVSVRTHPSKRFEIRADAGISMGFRVFENMNSSATNTNTGIILDHVISDEDWISRMNRFNFGITAALAVKFRLNDRMGILVGGGVRHGLTGLDSNVHNDFTSSKYLGQYNMLWAAPGKTVNQSFCINLGFTVLLNKEVN